MQDFSPPVNLSDQGQLSKNRGFPAGSDGKESVYNARDAGSIPESGRSQGEGNDYPIYYFAWRIPWTEEPGRLKPLGSQRVGQD